MAEHRKLVGILLLCAAAPVVACGGGTDFEDALVAEHLTEFPAGDYGAIVMLPDGGFAVVLTHEEEGWVVRADRGESSIAFGSLEGGGAPGLAIERGLHAPANVEGCEDVNVLDLDRNAEGEVLALDECKNERDFDLTIARYEPGADELVDPRPLTLGAGVSGTGLTVGAHGGGSWLSVPRDTSDRIVYAVGGGGCSALGLVDDGVASLLDIRLGDGGGGWDNGEYIEWEGDGLNLDCPSDGAAMLPDSCGDGLVAAVAGDADNPPPEPRVDREWDLRLFDSYDDPSWSESRTVVGSVRYLTMLEASASCRYLAFSGEVNEVAGLFVVDVESGELARVAERSFTGADFDEDEAVLVATGKTGRVGWSDPEDLERDGIDRSHSGIWTVDLDEAFRR